MGDEAARGHRAAKPTEIGKRGWKDIGMRVKDRLKEDHVPLLAAGVAFYAMLAIFPALIALVTVYGLVADPAEVENQVEALVDAIGPAGEAIGGQMSNIAETSSTALSIGLIASLLAVLWTASSGMQGLVKATNVAYNEPEKRSFFRLRGLSLLMSLGAIVFVILAIVLIGVVPVVIGFLGLGGVGQILAEVARWILLLGTAVVFLGVVYYFSPDRARARWRWITPGALIATVLWIVGSVLFSFYVSNFGNYNETYGALGGVIVLLLWLFLTSFVVLLGAEINAEMELQTEKDTTRGDPEPRGERGAVKADELPDQRTRS